MGLLDWILGNRSLAASSGPAPAPDAEATAYSAAPDSAQSQPQAVGSAPLASLATEVTHFDAPNAEFNDAEAWESYKGVWSEVRASTRPVFLTGRAGTGKSTFLRLARQYESNLRISVVAPTGVAAQNVEGVTIHRFFGFKLGALHPDDISYNPDRAEVLRAVDLLVIDEISMVRADVLDAIDCSLRVHRRDDRPFGGVAVLMIGDLSQLPPVVVGAESDRFFTEAYATPYFFSARVLLQSQFHVITLKKVHRQRDPQFLELLERVRSGQITRGVCEVLNERYIGGSGFSEDARPTVLTTTNDLANAINAQNLARLPGQARVFQAEVIGDVSLEEDAFQAPRRLEVKVGAKVMMVANDLSGRWVNGTTATVVGFHADALTIETAKGEFRVDRQSWSVVDYEYDRLNRRLKEVERGSFTQFPCRLGWAVTVHKSQGMTLDAVDIDFGQGAFAHGQAYVAFSRCRKLEGIGLRSRIRTTDVIVDPRVRAFFRMIEHGGAVDLKVLEDAERARVAADQVFPNASEAHLSLKDVVQAAILSRRKIEISYKDAKGELSRRVVEPLSTNGVSTFEAFCHKAGDKRNFKFDRVTGWRSIA